MTTVSSAWTSLPSPPSGAGRCCPSPPNEYKLPGSSPAARGRWSPAASCWKKLWDKDGNFIDDHTLTVTVNRLRKEDRGWNPYLYQNRSGYGLHLDGGGKMRAQAMARGLRPPWWPWGASSACGPWCGRPCPFPCFGVGRWPSAWGVVALVVWREVLWRRQTGDLANDLCDTVDAPHGGERLSRRTDL